MHHLDYTSVGLGTSSTLMAVFTGSGTLQVLSCLGVLSTIVYNYIKIRKELKK